MADILLSQSNLSEIPLRILATLPSTLPGAGFAHLLAQDTVDGKRAFLRLSDGSLVNLFTVNTETTIDNTIDNTVTNNNTVYQLNDLDISTMQDYTVPFVITNNGLKEWSWSLIPYLLIKKAIRSHREGQPFTASATLNEGQTDGYLNCTNGSAITLTIPVSATNLFDVIYSEIEFARNGAGAVNITPASGVTINGVTASISVSKQYGIVVLKLIALNTWVAYGDLA